MSLTKEQVQRLATFHDPTFKDRYPNYAFYHGLVRGLDHPIDGYVACDNDLTTYHAIIKDLSKDVSMKDTLTGRDTSALVDRIDSVYPQPIEYFLQRWFPDWKW